MYAMQRAISVSTNQLALPTSISGTDHSQNHRTRSCPIQLDHRLSRWLMADSSRIDATKEDRSPCLEKPVQCMMGLFAGDFQSITLEVGNDKIRSCLRGLRLRVRDSMVGNNIEKTVVSERSNVSISSDTTPIRSHVIKTFHAPISLRSGSHSRHPRRGVHPIWLSSGSYVKHGMLHLIQ